MVEDAVVSPPSSPLAAESPRRADSDEAALHDRYWQLRGMRRGAAAAAALTFVMGACGLAGRLSGQLRLASFVAGDKPMVLAAAVSLILLAAAIWTLTAPGSPRKGLTRALALPPVLIAGLRLIEYATGAHWDVSALLLSPVLPPPHYLPDYSIPGALVLAVLAVCCLLYSYPRSRAVALVCAIFGAACGTIFTLGYVYGRPLLTGSTLSPVALPAALALTSAAVALVIIGLAWEQAAHALFEQRRAADERELAAVAAAATRSANWLSGVISSIPDGVAIYGLQGEIVQRNQTFMSMLGYSEGDLRRPMAERTGPLHIQDIDGSALPLERYPAVRALHGESSALPIRIRRDGSPELIAMCSGAPIMDPEGTIRGSVVVLTDITELHQARERSQAQAREMQAQRDLVQAILEALPAGVVLLDGAELRVRLHNHLYSTFLDVPFRGRDLTGLRLEEFVPPAGYSGTAELYRRAAAGEVVHTPEWEFRGFERGVTYWNWTVLPLARRDGAGFDALGIVVDVTEQVVARRRIESLGREAAHRASELDTIINSIADGVAVYDREARIVRHNAAFPRLMNYSEHEVLQPLSRRLPDLTVTDERRQPLALEATPAIRALRGETVTGATLIFRAAGRDETVVGVSAAPLRGPDGGVTGAVVVVTDVQPLHRAQEEARRRADELDTIISSIADGVLIYNAKGRVTRANAAMERLLRYTGSEAGLPLEQLLALLDLRDAEGRVLPPELTVPARALKGETVLGLSLTARSGTPGEFTALYSGAPLRNAAGEIIGAVIIATDITARQQAEERLRASEKLLRRTQEIARLGSWELDLPTGRLTWSDEAYRVFGVSPAVRDVTYADFLQYVHPDDRDAVERAYTDSLQQGREGYEIEHRIIHRATGEVRVIHERCEHLRNSEGQVVASLGMAHDITGQVQARQRIEELAAAAEQRAAELDAIINAVADGVVVYDAEGRIVRQNQAAIDLVNYHPETWSMTVDERYRRMPPSDYAGNTVEPRRSPLGLALGGQAVTRYLMRFQVPERETPWLQTSAAPLRDASGAVTGAVMVFTDVTRMRQIEQQLRAHQDHLEELVSERTRALTENRERLRALAAQLVTAEQAERQRLAGLLHDEVAQSLGALTLHLSALRASHPETSEETEQLLELAGQATRQARSLLTELSPPVLQQRGLTEAIRWWAGVVAERNGLQIEVQAPAERLSLTPVLEVSLFQACKELLLNIVKHAAATRAGVTLACDPEGLTLTVEDNGRGFTPQEAQPTESGGFGLFSVRERMTYLGGSAAVDSAPGRGTSVTLRVPAGCPGPPGGAALADVAEQ